jgi:hypothetical protein
MLADALPFFMNNSGQETKPFNPCMRMPAEKSMRAPVQTKFALYPAAVVIIFIT